jgi:hypothetical protein
MSIQSGGGDLTRTTPTMRGWRLAWSRYVPGRHIEARSAIFVDENHLAVARSRSKVGLFKALTGEHQCSLLLKAHAVPGLLLKARSGARSHFRHRGHERSASIWPTPVPFADVCDIRQRLSNKPTWTHESLMDSSREPLVHVIVFLTRGSSRP